MSEPTPREPLSRGIKIGLAIAGTAAMAAGVAYWVWDAPRRTVAEARRLLVANPRLAESTLSEAIASAGGDFPEAQLLQCLALQAMGRRMEALGGLSLIRRPEDCPVEDYRALAYAAGKANDPLMANLALKAARRPGPLLEQVLRERVPLAMQLEPVDEVLPDVIRLTELAPADPAPWQLLGEIHQARKQWALAKKAYATALERKPAALQVTTLREGVVTVLIESGDLSAARAELDTIVGDKDASVPLSLLQVRLLRLEAKPSEALREVNLVLEKDPENAEALFQRGSLHVDGGRTAEAIADLQRVVQKDEHHREAHYKLAQAFLAAKRPDEAEPHLKISKQLADDLQEINRLEPRLLRELDNQELKERLKELYGRVGRGELPAGSR